MFAQTLSQQRGFGNNFKFPGEGTTTNGMNGGTPTDPAQNDDEDLYS